LHQDWLGSQHEQPAARYTLKIIVSNIRFINPQLEFSHLLVEKSSNHPEAIWHGQHHLEPGVYFARAPIGPHRLWSVLKVMDGRTYPFGWSVYAEPLDAKMCSHLLSTEEIAEIAEVYPYNETFDNRLLPMVQSVPNLSNVFGKTIKDIVELMRLNRWLQQEGISFNDQVGIRRIFSKVEAFREPIEKMFRTQAGWDSSLENPMIDAE